MSSRRIPVSVKVLNDNFIRFKKITVERGITFLFQMIETFRIPRTYQTWLDQVYLRVCKGYGLSTFFITIATRKTQLAIKKNGKGIWVIDTLNQNRFLDYDDGMVT
jgi:hypothetical protein